MSRYFLLTDEARKLVAECAWEGIESPTQSKLAVALGEVQMSIEFELNQLPMIQSFRKLTLMQLFLISMILFTALVVG